VRRRLCPGGGGECHSPKTSKTVQQVLRRLSQLAEQGDRVAVACMIPWIERGDCSTRAAAMRAAAKVARRGDHLALGAVLRGLRNPGPGNGAVVAACEALEQLTDPSDANTAEQVYALLQDSSTKVRCAALRALASVVPKGDARAVRAMLDRMDDKNEDIREAVMLALGQVVQEGDCRTLSHMLRGLRDASVHVRRATVEALQQASGGSFSDCTLRECDDAFSRTEAKNFFTVGDAVEAVKEEVLYRNGVCFIDVP